MSTPSIERTLACIRRWRQAEEWLTHTAPPDDLHHDTDAGTGLRHVDVQGDRFKETDINSLRRCAMADTVLTVAGRTSWREWPDLCHRPEGPEPPTRIDEVRIELETDDVSRGGRYFLYGTAASAGPPRIIGSCELRSFAEGDDETDPNDATVVIPTSFDQNEDLDWIADIAITQRLPDVSDADEVNAIFAMGNTPDPEA